MTFESALTFRGEMTVTQDGDSQRIIECQITSTNQRGGLVNVCDATLILEGLEAEC